MPRIYDRASNPVDFCNGCFPDEDEAEELFDTDEIGDGPDGRGNCFAYNAEHPPYTDDPDMYRCDTCRKQLEDEDD